MNTPQYMRVRHFTPALKFYRDMGAPVQRALQQAELSSEVELYPDSFIRHESEAEFLRYLRKREPVEDIGWQIYGHFGLHVADPAAEHELSREASIGNRIVKFRNSLWRANSFIRTRLTPVTDGMRFEYLDRQGQDSAENLCSDWTRIMAIVALVQTGLGSAWRPPKLGLTSSDRPCDDALSYFGGTQLFQKQETTWVDLPNATLAHKALPMPSVEASVPQSQHEQPGHPARDAPNYGSLSEMLKLMLLPYVSEGFPSLAAAAEMLACSRRSLQRRLRDEGCSYAELTRDLRIEQAQRLLSKGEMKLIDVAFAVGFDHPSNFSRAFMSSTGMSPRTFRRTCEHL